MRLTSILRTTLAAALALGTVSAGLVSASAPAAAQAGATAQAIADHFSTIRSMSGSFMQFDPNGQQLEGKFYIERPGRVRFDYAGAPLRVIADGRTVAVNNRRLNSWQTYPLSQTPLKLLLDQRIDLSAANIQSVEEGADLTTIVMGDSSVFGNSRITMMFDPATRDLKQWTIRDQQGKDTTVMIYDVQTGADIADSAFEIPYTAISQGQTGSNRR